MSRSRDRSSAGNRQRARTKRQRRRPQGQPAAGSALSAPIRLELVPAGPIDVKPDWWQRLVAIGSILSVLFVAVGLYVTNEANREQQRLTAQGQITDRFTKAVEQLGQPGPEKVDVRLGAIYALERIMRDSAADQPAVVDILAAFIRVHASASTTPEPPVTSPAGSIPDRPRLPVDIQTSLTVLGRRDVTRDKPGPGRVAVDLTSAHLTGADLTAADLSGADLTGANLMGANLIGAYLANTNLSDANLTRANLTMAFLIHTHLTGTDLAVANLTFADLVGEDLADANLARANLIGADLNGANLADAHLTGADLRCARTDDDTRLPAGVARPAPCSLEDWKRARQEHQ